MSVERKIFGVKNLAEATAEWLKLPDNCKELTGVLTKCNGRSMLLNELFPSGVTRKVKFLKPYRYPFRQGSAPVEPQDFTTDEEVTIDKKHKLYPILLMLYSIHAIEEI